MWGDPVGIRTQLGTWGKESGAGIQEGLREMKESRISTKVPIWVRRWMIA